MNKVFKPLIIVLFLYVFSYITWVVITGLYIFAVVIYGFPHSPSPFLDNLEPILSSILSKLLPLCPLWWVIVAIISFILILLCLINLIKYIRKKAKKK